ncbi:MAG: NmrA family NAD(P)-binding protein [Candidatus Acidiferrales bacterium]
MYVITGATGHTGSVLANMLLAKGEKVRVIGRSKERLDPFVQKGAEAFVGDIDDAEAMTRAFTGARAVYAMIPPNHGAPDLRASQERTSDSLIAALEKSGVTHAICLSSMGADKSERVGPVNGLHSYEQKINRLPKLNALILRPTYFMQNNLVQAKIIQSMGTMGGILKADLPLPQIDAKDIGAYTADAIVKLNFTGKTTRELLGQRDVSMKETAAIFGEAIGKPKLGYSEFPAFAVEMGMKQMGMSENLVKLMIEMLESINDGWMKPLETRSAENTTPTSIETFATEEFAPLFQGKAAIA